MKEAVLKVVFQQAFETASFVFEPLYFGYNPIMFIQKRINYAKLNTFVG